MDMNSFLEHCTELFEDLTQTLTPETKFREIPSWSSLTALSIIAMVDEEYGVTLSGEDIKNSETFQDILNKIVAKK